MLPSQLNAVEAIMNVRLQAASDQREFRDLLSRAGFDQRSWLVQHGLWVLDQLGCLLVAVGHWMQGLAPRADATALDYNAGR